MMEENASQSGNFKPSHDPNCLLQQIPDLTKIAKIDSKLIFNKDSANFCAQDWIIIAETIYENYSRYDGFVVIHGTDTMSYTASALSFILQGLNKPVILTGSQIPLSEVASDGRNNVINAVRFAGEDIAEVCIFFGSRLIRGNKSTKISEFDLRAFETVNAPYLGKVGLDIILRESYRHPSPQRNLELKTDFDTHVAIIKIFPNINISYFETLLQTGIRGIVIEGFGAGNLPDKDERFDAFFKKCQEKDMSGLSQPNVSTEQQNTNDMSGASRQKILDASLPLIGAKKQPL
ncbi:asparaginase [Candidatus Gracilibacteria bacterium]|nr:asparaginase [Candidatus Gracilibacteria bacterium]